MAEPGQACRPWADAPECTIGNLSGSYRYVKLAFGPRDEGRCFTRVEVEAWAKP